MACIAIDGPAGAGKSTIAKAVAAKLNATYVDTGAMYRGIAYYIMNKGYNPEDEVQLLQALSEINLEIQYGAEGQEIWLNHENITPFIRKEEVGKMASTTSSKPQVREKLLSLQRNMAKQQMVVMDGRDIGTNVVQDAPVKIYLTASSKTRAMRRYKELMEKGEACDLEAIEQDIIQRDYADMHREIAPLKQAADAVFLDSSDMTIEEVVEQILACCKEKGLWKSN